MPNRLQKSLAIAEPGSDRDLSLAAPTPSGRSLQPQLAHDINTQSEWDVLTGAAMSGPLEGTQLEQAPITYALWFGWIDYHTDSTVYGIER